MATSINGYTFMASANGEGTLITVIAHKDDSGGGKTEVFKFSIAEANDLCDMLKYNCKLAKDRRQPRHGHTEGGTTDIIQSDRVAEDHAGGVAAVFAADADLQAGAGLAALLDAHLHEGTDAVLVDRREGVVR